MKKLILSVTAIGLIGLASCKKEEGAQPQIKINAVKLEKKDTTQWD